MWEVKNVGMEDATREIEQGSDWKGV